MGKKDLNGATEIKTTEIPPNVPCCGNCAHAIMQQMKPPNIMRVLVCKYLPPNTVVQRDGRGHITGYTSLSPVVDPRDYCAQFISREEVAKESQAANDASIPTGGID